MKTRTIILRAGMAVAVAMIAHVLAFSSAHAKTRADGVMPPDPGQTEQAAPAGTAQPQGATAQRLTPGAAQPGVARPASEALPQGVNVGPSPQGVRIGPGPGMPGPQGINIGPGPVMPGPQGINIGPPRPRFQIRVWTDQNNYRPGDKMRVYFRATQDCYLYLFNTDARGVERQIFPNHFDQDNFISGNVTFYIPDRSYEFTVTGPGGREKLYAIAVPERYEVVRPFNRFSRDEPFPKLQALALLNGLRGSLQVIIGDGRTPAHQPDRIGPQGIIVNPAPRQHEYAEDFVFYNVRPRGSAYDPYGRPTRTGQLRVTTTPSDAVVHINGEYRGKTPLTIDRLPYGNYRVWIGKNGYEGQTHWVRIDGPSMGYLNVRMVPDRPGRPRPFEGGGGGRLPGGVTSGLPPAVEKPGGGGISSPIGGAVEKRANR